MKTFVFPVLVGFGDCDPAGIVYYPNFFRWFDAATHTMFFSFGESHERAQREHGWTVWPLIDAGATFRAPVRPNERIEVHSTIEQWTTRTFRIAHRVLRDGTLVADGWELRFIGQAHPDDPRRLRAVPIPPELKALFDSQPPVAPDREGRA